MSDPPRKTKSGEHPEVQAFRDKLDSIREHTIPAIEEKTRESEEIRDEIKSLQPPPSLVPCVVCDSERTVPVGAGVLDCPACVGLRRDGLTDEQAQTVEAMCAGGGVAVRWLT